MLTILAGCPAIEQTTKITDIKSSDGSQRFVPLLLEDTQETVRYIDRDMHPRVLKAQVAHANKKWPRKAHKKAAYL